MEGSKNLMGKIRVGIIGTGRITGRFAGEVRTVPEAEITCVYNPHIGSAEKFVDTYKLGEPTDRVERLLELTDAVYVAAPHETHVPYSRKLLLAGKHVLCEKPLAFSEKEARELFALAEEKGLVLMEAVKTAYCPGFLALLEKVQGGAIGEICDVEAVFTKLSPSNVREVWGQYGGSFSELGTYPLLPIVKLLGTGNTDNLFRTLRMGTGNDGYAKAFFSYPDAMAEAVTGLSVKSEGQLLVSGTKGYILAEAPWWLTKRFEVRYEDSSKREVYEFPYEGAGLRYEIQAFIQNICGIQAGRERTLDPTPEERIRTAREKTLDLTPEKCIGTAQERTLGLVPEESIWIARQMESFQAYMGRTSDEGTGEIPRVRIWAHRGCSLRFPENTLEAFAAAAALPGITGIELDVQLTRDGVPVVIHDETVDRTTDGTGAVQGYTLEELKRLSIQGVHGTETAVPTLEEVFGLLEASCRERGLLINLELKNSRIRYEGMEEKVIAMAARFGLGENVVYSSFSPESMGLIKRLNPAAETGILGKDAMACLKAMKEMNADAIHPSAAGLPLEQGEIRRISGVPVRVWGGDSPLFGQGSNRRETDMTRYQVLGATDIITNVPENYL